MNVAPVELQRALILALHTGQRQGDLLRLAWTNYDGHLITLRQGETNRRVDIPCTAALKRMLGPLEKKSTVILATKSGLPWRALLQGAVAGRDQEGRSRGPALP